MQKIVIPFNQNGVFGLETIGAGGDATDIEQG